MPGSGVVAHGGPSSWLLPLLAAALPALAYLGGVARIRRVRGRRWRPARTASFLTGCALVLVGLSPVVEGAAADTTRAHVLQHLLLGMYAPIGLVLGAPVTLLLGATALPVRARIRSLLGAPVVRAATHLAVATTLVVGGLFVLYLTPLYALSTRSALVHHAVHLHFVVSGCVFTWVVAGPDPSRHRPRLAWRVAVLVAASGAHAFLAKLLYARAPTLPPGAGLGVDEVEQAAQWMYYGGHVAEGALLVALFAGWYRRAPRLRAARHHSTGAAPLGRPAA